MRRLSLLPRAGLFLFFAYLFPFGGTFNGVVLPQIKWVTLVLMTIIVALWLVTRWRQKWIWYRTSLDNVLILWAMAFGLSLLANSEVWRRILIGLWFVGVYLGVWYIVQDALANGALKRGLLVDAFLFAGLLVLIFGYIQLGSSSFDLAQFRLPRPGSTIGNPNSLGAYLIVLIALAAGRAAFPRNPAERIVMGFYTLVAGLLLFFTFSRGAWLGSGAALGILGLMVLHQRDLLSWSRLRVWWVSLVPTQKNGLIAGFLAILVVLILVGVLFWQSFSQGGRSSDLRLNIYRVAVDLFVEKPLTGHGLFTFGRGLERSQSMPPQQPHSHAHNVILNVAAELGVFGLIAMFVTVFIALGMIRRNWREVTLKDQAALAGSTAAVVGFGVHHLTDTPFMMVTVALSGMLVLIVATAPLKPVPITATWRRLGHPIAIVGLCVLLLGSGFWSARVVSRYFDALLLVNEDDYRGAAQQMQAAIDADPALSVYHQQQGFLYGMASLTMPDSAENAIAAYENFVKLEPQSAVGWANLAGLYWQVGRQDEAIVAMENAVEAAPLSWQLWFNLGSFRETAGDLEGARTAYANALPAGTIMYPAWQETELRREIAQQTVLSDDAQMAERIIQAYITQNTLDEAFADLWWVSREKATTANTVIYMIAISLIYEPPPADYFEDLIAEAVLLSQTEEDQAWIHLGRGWLARYADDEAGALSEFDEAQSLIAPGIGRQDYVNGINFGYALSLRYVAPRQFLPQVYYPTANPLLVYLLENSS